MPRLRSGYFSRDLVMNKREFLAQLGLVAVGAGIGLVFRDVVLDRDADRRFALYNIMRELLQGMSRSDVDTIISRHDAPFIVHHAQDNSISLSVMLGGINSFYLAIEFSSGKLTKAHFGGEDNPRDVPKDAPANIQ